MFNKVRFGSSGGGFQYPITHSSQYGAYGSTVPVYTQAAASASPDGGTVVAGALLLFLGIKAYQHLKENNSQLGAGLSDLFKIGTNKRPNFNPPPAQTYHPSYYGVASQKDRVAYVSDVPGAKAGQDYSNALIDLGNQMRKTNSLQEALNHQESDGYLDVLVGEGKSPSISKGKHFGVQSAQQFYGFKKADNANPHKPRYVVCIGSSTKRDQFQRLTQTMQEEYGVAGDHIIYSNGTTPAAIEAAFKEAQARTAKEPHAEIVATVMPDHSNRKDPKLGEGPEGAQEVTFFDENTQNQKVTEADYKRLLNTYLGDKKTLTIFTACRAGSIVA